MIINCDKCNKKFNIKDNLIPEGGRKVKCGYCSNVWLFTPILEKNNTISINDQINIKNNNKDKQDSTLNRNKKINKDISNNILKNSLIILITFAAIILIFDTFEQKISLFLPGIVPLLDNLYLTFFDIQLFIKDLFN